MAEEQELGTIMAEEAAFLRRLGSCHACHPPFGWQALAKPPPLVALCMEVPTTASISMHTHSCPVETLTND